MIIDKFKELVDGMPTNIAFISLERKTERTFSYGELGVLVRKKSLYIQRLKKSGPAILLYDDTIEFLTSFLACQNVGIIPIPMFFPRNKRHFDRLKEIVLSSESELILCTSLNFEKVIQELERIAQNITVSIVDNESETIEDLAPFVPATNPTAFIQYTSGSTSRPKGVIISQENVMHNQKMLSEIFQCDQNSVILTWLPFYHDMGLIGNLLHTLFNGCKCVILKPSAVVNNPLLWLKTIEEYQVTHTGGPNFIYDLCHEKITESEAFLLDLSSLNVVYNGSEPVKSKTVINFIDKFKRSLLDPSAYKTCYGLAECTLVVSGGEVKREHKIVGSGPVASELDVVLFDHEANKESIFEGEICVNGASVSEGYWKVDSTEFFIVHNGKKYIKTGDIGFYRNNELVISGRIKEMLILNGQNVFPYDLESTIQHEIEELMLNGVAVTSKEEKLFVFAEIERSYLKLSTEQFNQIRNTINQLLIETIGLESQSIFFVLPRTLPRTSSGKVQRSKLINALEIGELVEVDSSIETVKVEINFDLESFSWNDDSIEEYLKTILMEKLKIHDGSDLNNKTFFELGLSSIKAVELINRINADLKIEVELESVFELNQLDKVGRYILDLKWLQTDLTEEQEIEL